VLRIRHQLIELVDDDCLGVNIKELKLLLGIKDVAHHNRCGKEDISEVPGGIVYHVLESNLQKVIVVHFLLSLWIWR